MFHLFIFRSLWYDRWINAAVLLGVFCATAVLTGALLVGDSMRGSLKALTLNRLEQIDTVLLAPAFITPPDFIPNDFWMESVPVIYLPAVAESGGKVCGIQILGIKYFDNSIFADNFYVNNISDNDIIVNRTLAEQLGISTGSVISLRLNPPQQIPPESSLGRRDQLIRTKLTVNLVAPDHGISRFSLKADQRPEPLLIVPLSWLQQKLGVGEKINTVFFPTQNSETISTEQQRKSLEQLFKPTLDDFGITAEIRNEQYYIKSTRLLFTKPQADAIQKALPNTQPGLLYLATSIRATKNNRESPYSTIYAANINTTNNDKISIGTNNLKDNEIILNRWTADDLDAEIGDEIELTWFEPDNVNITKFKKFKLSAILPMDGLGADAHLVPEIQGFTDEESIADWDPPFPFDAKKIRKKDEDYWDKYRAAPKAFLLLKTARELFGSRFGNTTTFLTEYNTETIKNWEQKLTPSVFGLNFIPVKEQGITASAGTTPFSVLFLSFSFFIIASALMLVLMLFRLSVDRKAKQIGICLAAGWTPLFIAKGLLIEGAILAVGGAFLGTLLSIVYARLMVYGLTTWWVNAVTVPFLTLYVNPLSLIIGFVSGSVLAVLTITLTLRKSVSSPIKSLLAGTLSITETGTKNYSGTKNYFCQKKFPFHSYWFTLIILLVISVLMLIGFSVHFNNPVVCAGLFFSLGVLILVSGLRQVHYYSCAGGSNSPFIRSLFSFAVSNISRYPVRNTLCIGLIASTCFLILSISVFQMDASSYYSKQQLIAETQFPVYENLNSSEGRSNISIQQSDSIWFEQNAIRVQSFRVRDGDNAGCLNLYQPLNPRILGVPKEKDWPDLDKPITIDEDGIRRVPIFLDTNTAMYSLHIYGGVGSFYEIEDGQGGKIRCEITGLLTNSLFQGDILMSEQNLLTLFPDVAGYRFFIVDSNLSVDKNDHELVSFLYRNLGDYGVTAESNTHRLQRFFAVQNTYLATFQSLGGIGLLLGLFGLAAVQFRNVFERRKELALLNTLGFRPSRILLLLLYENFTVLFLGLFLAILASVFSLFPQFLFTQWKVNPLSAAIQFSWLLGGMVIIGVLSNIAAALAVLKIPVAKELAEEH
ncbi:MAG: ABC transporter permease [Planctomycetaceae bacterium]|jgi:ABC-type antimicrobial peptide transport system permease subunit|nr:ABC transporter permease [Planctomycetaceae bacterium]